MSDYCATQLILFASIMARATMHGTVIIIDRHADRGIIRDASGMFYNFLRRDMAFWMDFEKLHTGTAVTFELRRRKRISRGAINVELRKPDHT